MNCVICKHSDTKPGMVTVTLQRNSSVVLVKGVPANVCPNCGEYYLSDETTKKVMTLANKAIAVGAEVTVAAFAA